MAAKQRCPALEVVGTFQVRTMGISLLAALHCLYLWCCSDGLVGKLAAVGGQSVES